MDLGLDPPGLGRASVFVVPGEVGEDRGVLLGMGSIVGAVERERAERLEVALDEVEPARVGGREHELDAVLCRPRPELGLAVRAPVVEGDDEVLAEAGPDVLQQLLRLLPRLVVAEVADHRAVRRVVGGEQVANAAASVVALLLQLALLELAL